MGLTCSRCVALKKGAWAWLTASIRALAVFAICSISMLYSRRRCFSLATPGGRRTEMFLRFLCFSANSEQCQGDAEPGKYHSDTSPVCCLLPAYDQKANFTEKCFIWVKYSLCLVDFGVIENSLLSFMAIFLPAISSYIEDRYSSGRSLLSLIPRFILMYCSFVILFFTYIKEEDRERQLRWLIKKGGNGECVNGTQWKTFPVKLFKLCICLNEQTKRSQNKVFSATEIYWLMRRLLELQACIHPARGRGYVRKY